MARLPRFASTSRPGTEKVVTFYIVQYQARGDRAIPRPSAQADVRRPVRGHQRYAQDGRGCLPAVIARCEEMDAKLADSGQDEERQFLAADALHSYQYNTILHATREEGTGLGRDRGGVLLHQHLRPDGGSRFLRTGDASLDRAERTRSFPRPLLLYDELTLPGQTQRSPGGLGFWHDMGTRINFSNHEKGAAYKTLMTQEELQNWILCARALLEDDRR